MKLSKKTIRALSILLNAGEVTARQFAKMMWPASPGWKIVRQRGKRQTIGLGMWLAGGSYLNRLRYKGLVEWSVNVVGGYRISEKGKAALNAKNR